MSCLERTAGRLVTVLLTLVLAAPAIHAATLNSGDSLPQDAWQASGALLPSFTSTSQTPDNALGTAALNSEYPVVEFNYLGSQLLPSTTTPSLAAPANTAQPAASQPTQKSSSQGGNSAFRPDLAPIPEPTSVALMVSGVAFVGSLLARKRKL